MDETDRRLVFDGDIHKAWREFYETPLWTEVFDPMLRRFSQSKREAEEAADTAEELFARRRERRAVDELIALIRSSQMALQQKAARDREQAQGRGAGWSV